MLSGVPCIALDPVMGIGPCDTLSPWQQALLGSARSFWALSGRKGKRGSRGGGIVPKGLSRNERRSDAGFSPICKCDRFTAWPPDVSDREPWRKGQCRNCGSYKPEWRCPVHKLKATPLDAEASSEGCPRCGRSPKEQKHDQYMTVKARTE